VDLLAKKDKLFFSDLQDFAKRGADSGSLRVVFVSSEGVALPLLKASSAWSRAGGAYEVQDLPDGLAVSFLEGQGVPFERATRVVRDITGGRLSLLLHLASTSVPDDATILTLDDETQGGLLDAGVQPDHELFKALSDSDHIGCSVAKKLVGQTALDALLAANILAVHPNSTYSFHSRHTAVFFKNLHPALPFSASAPPLAAASS
jgi:hypothetical protein